MATKWAPQAQQDLIDIYLESIRQFGTRQAERYIAELTLCAERLASMPLMARSEQRFAHLCAYTLMAVI